MKDKELINEILNNELRNKELINEISNITFEIFQEPYVNEEHYSPERETLSNNFVNKLRKWA